MKTKTYFITAVALLISLLLATQQGCKKEEKKPEQPDISIVDISQETNWDYWIVGKKDYYYLKVNSSVPEVMSFHSSEANKDYTIFYDKNGNLDKVVVDDYIFIFRNFNGNKVDIAVIYPNGDIEILREVETNYNWVYGNFKEGNNSEAWSDVIRGAARIAAGVPCALSAATAIASGGIATPIALWTCGNFLLNLTVDVMENDFNVQNGFTDFVDTYGTISLLQGCSSPDLTGCALDLASEGLHEWADHLALIESQQDEVQNAEAALEFGYGDVQVTLTWDNVVDLDLHVIDPSGEEIFWDHPHSFSGGSLDVDDIDGYGPENIYWPLNNAPNGTYQVYIHQYPWDSDPNSSNYTVFVYAFGHTKTFSGSIIKDQVINITSFNQNGFISGRTTPVENSTTRIKNKNLKP